MSIANNDRRSYQNDLDGTKTGSNRKSNDIFSEFESSRNVLLSNSDKKYVGNEKLAFRSKSKQSLNQDQQQYGDDFQQQAQESKKISKNNKKKTQTEYISERKPSTKEQQNHRQEKHQKNIQKRQVKSVLQNQNSELQSSKLDIIGKYSSEIDKKFNQLDIQKAGAQQIIRNNQLIRQYIKKYNDTLTQIINRNLNNFTVKKKKVSSVDDVLKVMQEQIKNNAKIEQLDLIELRKLQEHSKKLDEQEEYQENNYQQQKSLFQAKLKQKKKQIYNAKLLVENEGKKLIPDQSMVMARHQFQSEASTVKEKLQLIRRQFQKNNERIVNLQSQQNQLMAKINRLGNIDKQADMLRTNTKQYVQRAKRYQQIRKKHEAVKLHQSKTQSLWNTKCGVIQHQIQAIKMQVKNMELQIKNIEQSVKLAVQKSMKTLLTAKPRCKQNQKNLDKIKNEIISYNSQVSITKQASLSQVKILTKKKYSTDKMMPNLTNIQKQKQGQKSKEEEQVKTKSQESQRNRVWKQNSQQPNLIKSKTQKNNLKTAQQIHFKNQAQLKVQNKKESTNLQNQNKPKKFNFRKKSNLNIIDKQSQNETKLPTIQDQKSHNQETSNQKSYKQLPVNVKDQPYRKEETLDKPSINQNNQNVQVPQIKKFNLKDRKNKQQQQDRQNMHEVKKHGNNEQKQDKVISQIDSQTVKNNKPLFNIKKSRQKVQKQKLDIDNQFMS